MPHHARPSRGAAANRPPSKAAAASAPRPSKTPPSRPSKAAPSSSKKATQRAGGAPSRPQRSTATTSSSTSATTPSTSGGRASRPRKKQRVDAASDAPPSASESTAKQPPGPSRENKRKRDGDDDDDVVELASGDEESEEIELSSDEEDGPASTASTTTNGTKTIQSFFSPVGKRHGLKCKSAKKATIKEGRPRNDAEREVERKKKQPSVYGFVSFPKGAKPKTAHVQVETTENEEAGDEEAPMPKSGCKLSKPSTSRGGYIDYDDPVVQAVVQAGFKSMVETGGHYPSAKQAMREKNNTVVIPRQSFLGKWKKRVKEVQGDDDDEGSEEDADGMGQFDRHRETDKKGKKKAGLTSAATRNLLQSIATARDKNNKGMSRKEMICLIAELESVNAKTAENHYDYLVREGKLPELKRGGRVVTAQPTTTNRSAITTEKLLRTHNTVQLAWEMQKQLNGRTPEERAEFESKKDFFTCNLDEMCVIASDGTVRVLGAAEKRKQEKNMADCRDSITTVRVGSAANGETFANFCKHHTAPAGSCVLMTPSAYMTDETWREGATKLCQGIRQMDGIRDHPDFWVVFSLDGFGSHLDSAALEVFAEHKILVIKEEGDTSHVSQAYDAFVAKEDKRFSRELMDTYRAGGRNMISQWELIILVNSALNLVEETDAWRQSFIRVNMCPSKCVPFRQWVQKIEESVNAADRFFTNRSGLFDATPAAWKHLTEVQRRSVCSVLESLEGSWTKEGVVKMMELGFVAFDDIPKLRGCYLLSKEDPSIFVAPSIPAAEESAAPTPQRQWMLDRDFDGFSFAPRNLLEAFRADKAKSPANQGPVQGHHGPRYFDHPLAVADDPENPGEKMLSGIAVPKENWRDNWSMGWPQGRSKKSAAALFCHMTNFVASNHGWHKGGSLTPSPYLHLEISEEQVDLLNPTPRDVQLGAIIDQCVGAKAQKVIAKRRVDMVAGNVQSYARILNGPAQLSKIRTYNDLAASMAEYKRERAQREEKARKQKKADDAEKAAKQMEKKRLAGEERDRLLPICQEQVALGLQHVLSLNVKATNAAPDIHMFNILKYVYNHPEAKTGLKKPRAVELLTELTGDFFSNLIAGAREQASLLGATVTVDDAGGDDATQAYLVATRTGGNPIVTVGGSGDALCPAINVKDAYDRGRRGYCDPVLDQALNDLGRDLTVGYVNDLNYAPLAKRNEVWEEYKEANGWEQAFFVADAANFSSAEALQSAIETELEGVAPVDFIYAPWDYLSINTVAALRATNASGTAVYGADFNDEDIAVMIEPDSPWKATAGGDPRAIGAALIRMVAIDAAGELNETQVTIPSVLVTQSYLLDNNITDLMELDDANPELELPDFMRACWIPESGTGENDDSSSARAFSTAAVWSLAVGVASVCA
ncbi:hypothetical protein ACHAXT_000277 [Thalassiosira profunda]